ncbi:hypothetical protein N431DRAFT_357646 [Stipitochalara longipes BDJ]|nr:hypothetical protein N431DRAFT_357646 [Stipitochalara longipes BDJ]
MQNTSRTASEMIYSGERVWRAWRSSSARKQHINFLLADGCTPAGANKQADFDFDAHTQRLGGRRTSPEEEIAMFEENNNEMQLWSLWSNSDARVKHITSLLIIGFSNEGAIEQADTDFKAHCSGFANRKSSPEAEIETFEQFSNDQTLKKIWQLSHARGKHIKNLLAKGLSPNGAAKQADIDFYHHSQELAKRDITAEEKIEAFEEYFDTMLGFSNEEDRSAEFKLGERDEAKCRDSLWRHLCHLAGLEPREVIGEFDRILNSKNEKRAVEDFLLSLENQFKATGVTENVVETAMKAFEDFVGLD